jgi:hypothetical protein
MIKKQEESQLLVFGYGLPVICFILVWCQYVKHGLTVWVEGFIMAGGIVLWMAMFAPSILKLMFKYWMNVAQVINKIVTAVILTLLFFCVITPASIILRLMGKDFMNLGFKSQLDSYWIKRKNKNEGYTQQF